MTFWLTVKNIDPMNHDPSPERTKPKILFPPSCLCTFVPLRHPVHSRSAAACKNPSAKNSFPHFPNASTVSSAGATPNVSAARNSTVRYMEMCFPFGRRINPLGFPTIPQNSPSHAFVSTHPQARPKVTRSPIQIMGIYSTPLPDRQNCSTGKKEQPL